jgi:hypothetical protein
MNEQLSHFGVGARFVSADALTDEHLGPLKALVGEWGSVTLQTIDSRGAAQITPSGWNVISVPGGSGFVFEVIPYVESLKFSTVAVQAGNRGPVFNGKDADQQVYGLFYEQQIKSVCDTDFCNSRGFGKDNIIHAETGMFLYVKEFSGGYTIARLSTIPHGNAVLALGTSDESTKPGTSFFDEISAAGTNLDGSAISILGYNDQIIGERQFPLFSQATPNAFLKSTLDTIVGMGVLESMTTLKMSTNAPNAEGGILNIPFIQKNVTAASMDATFWLENITGGSETELLQYSQTINLVFPPVGTATPVKWPHVTISTLKRIPQANMPLQADAILPGVPEF